MNITNITPTLGQGVKSVFPGLRPDQSDWVRSKVDSMGIKTPLERLNKEQEIYRGALQKVNQQKLIDERSKVKSDMYYQTTQEKDIKKKKQVEVQLRISDVADLVKQKKGLRADAPDFEVFRAFGKENEQLMPLLEKYVNEGDEQFLYKSGLKEYTPQQMQKDMFKQQAEGFKNLVGGVGESVSGLGEFIGDASSTVIGWAAKKLGANPEKVDELVKSYQSEFDTLGGETVGDQESGLYKGSKIAADVAQIAEGGLAGVGMYKAYKAAKATDQAITAGKLLNKTSSNIYKEAIPAIDKGEDVMNNPVANSVWEYLQPKLTSKKFGELASKKALYGKAKPPTFLGAPKLTPDDYELKTIKYASEVINPRKTHIENITNIGKTIDNESKLIKETLKSNDAIFNTRELTSRLNKIEKPIALVGDEEKIWENIMSKVTTQLKGKKKNLSSLMDYRIEFDGWVAKARDIYKGDTSTALDQSIRLLRKGLNDFIIEKAGPNGEIVAKSLEKQSHLFDAVGDLTTHVTDKTKLFDMLSQFSTPIKYTIYAIAQQAAAGAAAFEIVKATSK